MCCNHAKARTKQIHYSNFQQVQLSWRVRFCITLYLAFDILLNSAFINRITWKLFPSKRMIVPFNSHQCQYWRKNSSARTLKVSQTLTLETKATSQKTVLIFWMLPLNERQGNFYLNSGQNLIFLCTWNQAFSQLLQNAGFRQVDRRHVAVGEMDISPNMQFYIQVIKVLDPEPRIHKDMKWLLP